MEGDGDWDHEAATFDLVPDHGLLDVEVRQAWRRLLRAHLPPAPAQVLDVSCGTRAVHRRGRREDRVVEEVQAERAVTASISVARALGLDVERAVVLSSSNRMVTRLLPSDVVARASPVGWFSAAREVELAGRLGPGTDGPIAGLDPRVEPRIVLQDRFEVSLWTYLEPVPGVPSPAEFTQALRHLHRALRQVEVGAPHVADRLVAIRRWLTDEEATPDLTLEDRALILHRLEPPRGLLAGQGAGEQLLHGEPHPWNVLTTRAGLRFIDFENCARGPIEYDLAWVPEEVSERYTEADQALVGACRALVLALVAAHRWHRDDRHPSGRPSGVAFLDALRAGPPWPSLDAVHW